MASITGNSVILLNEDNIDSPEFFDHRGPLANLSNNMYEQTKYKRWGLLFIELRGKIRESNRDIGWTLENELWEMLVR